MDRYAVFGNPIAHSRSPFIHNFFAEETGEDISYEKILAPLDGFRTPCVSSSLKAAAAAMSPCRSRRRPSRCVKAFLPVRRPPGR